MDGLEWLRTACDQQPDLPVIVLSAQSTVDDAVDAVKRGAYHYVSKDGNLDALTLLVRQALDAGMFRSQGIEPTRKRVLVLKSSVHYRGAFEPLAARVVEVDTPGLSNADLSRYPYAHVRRPIFPLDSIE